MKCPTCTTELVSQPAPANCPNCLPLPVPRDDGTFQIVNIPRMTTKEFAFFTDLLDIYRGCIVSDLIGTGTGVGLVDEPAYEHSGPLAVALAGVRPGGTPLH